MLEKNRRLLIIIASIFIVLFGIFYNNLLKQKQSQDLSDFSKNSENLISGDSFANNFENSNLDNQNNMLDTSPLDIIIYVTGEVVNSGVYTLKSNQRISDAIDMAGGATENADLMNINLAGYLEDAMQIIVPKLGDITENTPKAPDKIDDGKVNINTADQLELEQLPNVGSTTAKSIIAYREKEGDFKSIEELIFVPGIGQKTFLSMEEFIKIE